MTLHREQNMKKEKKEEKRTKALSLHLVCCSGSAGCGW